MCTTLLKVYLNDVTAPASNFRKEIFYLTNHKCIIWIICNLNPVSFWAIERISELSKSRKTYFPVILYRCGEIIMVELKKKSAA